MPFGPGQPDIVSGRPGPLAIYKPNTPNKESMQICAIIYMGLIMSGWLGPVWIYGLELEWGSSNPKASKQVG